MKLKALSFAGVVAVAAGGVVFAQYQADPREGVQAPQGDEDRYADPRDRGAPRQRAQSPQSGDEDRYGEPRDRGGPRQRAQAPQWGDEDRYGEPRDRGGPRQRAQSPQWGDEERYAEPRDRGRSRRQGDEEGRYAGPREQGGPRPALADCRADIQALCGSTEARGGRRMQCLAENRDRVSQPCAAAIDSIVGARADRGDRGRARQGMRDGEGWRAEGARAGGGMRDGGSRPMAACRLDMAKLCGDAERGGGRMRCLTQHAAELSPKCSGALQAMQAAREQARRACRADVRSLCQDAGPGRGAMSCLRENRDEVSPGCAAALAELPFMARAEGYGRRMGPGARGAQRDFGPGARGPQREDDDMDADPGPR